MGDKCDFSDDDALSSSFCDLFCSSNLYPVLFLHFAKAVWFCRRRRISSSPFLGRFTSWYFRISREWARFVFDSNIFFVVAVGGWGCYQMVLLTVVCFHLALPSVRYHSRADFPFLCFLPRFSYRQSPFVFRRVDPVRRFTTIVYHLSRRLHSI